MNLNPVEMTKETALEILSWKYEPPYDFYSNEADSESLDELLDGSYLAIKDQGDKLIGFYCTGENAQVPKGREVGVYEEECMDMGLGMAPELTGKGNGLLFGSFVVNEIEGKMKGLPIRLTVAAFNKRAIRLYEKLGFVVKNGFKTGSAEFITMMKRGS